MNPTSSKPGRVAFFITLHKLPQFHGFSPPGNWLGTGLLLRLLENALAARLSEPPVLALALELNRCAGMVAADDRDAALDVIITELRAVALLDAALVVTFDERELVWRRHPAGCPGPDLLDAEALYAQAGEISRVLLRSVIEGIHTSTRAS